MRKTRVAAVIMVGIGLAGCAKRSAESAIARADETLAAVRPEAEKIAPNELKAMTDSVAAMKARVAAGDHSGALMGARTINSMARDLQANLPKRKEQLTASFNSTAAEMPKEIEAVTARVAEFGKLRRLPPGLDPAKFAALQTEVPGWSTSWTQATESFKAGNLAAALNLANELKARIADAKRTLMMT